MDRKQIEELRVDIQNLMSNREKIDMPEGEPMYGISPYHIEKIQIGFNDLLLHIERLEAEKNLESVSAGLLRDEIVELESTLATYKAVVDAAKALRDKSYQRPRPEYRLSTMLDKEIDVLIQALRAVAEGE